jgi:GTPase SAR1 family protein
METSFLSGSKIRTLSQEENIDVLLKRDVKTVVVFGYANVGKTSLISKYIFNHFPRHHDNSKLANNVLDQGLRKFVKYDKKKIELEVRDTPSYDKYFIFVSQKHSIKIDGYILMYSVDNLSSFELVKEIRSKLYTLNN